LLGLAFFLAAIGVAFTVDKLEASLISASSGAIVEVISGLNFWLYSRTSNQLNFFHIRLERMQKYLLANSVAANLSAEAKDRALSELVKTIADEVNEPYKP
jgi:hypothetical protein